MSSAKTRSIAKVLSANDVGLTGAHQAGIVVPKDPNFLTFFPKLDAGRKNPDARVTVSDTESNQFWTLRFIYYNGKTLGDGTRNEYRLTGMTGLLRELGAEVGDTLRFTRTVLGDIVVSLDKASNSATGATGTKLAGGWQIISVEDE